MKAANRGGGRAADGSAHLGSAARPVGAGAKDSLKVVISLVWFAGCTTRRWLLGHAGRKREPRFTVLYYHGIPEAKRGGFARQMATLARDFTVLPADYKGRLPPSREYCVAITFDDAFRSVLQRGVPELVRHSLPATIFVPVGYVGRAPAWASTQGLDGGEEVMSPDELRSLPELVALGSHTQSHPHLRAVDDLQLSREIEGSRSELADLRGTSVMLLAFPYGEYDERAVRACRDAGYERVYGIEPRAADPRGSDFVRGRVPVEPSDSRLVFGLKARGAYAWMPYASALKARAHRRHHHSR